VAAAASPIDTSQDQQLAALPPLSSILQRLVLHDIELSKQSFRSYLFPLRSLTYLQMIAIESPISLITTGVSATSSKYANISTPFVKWQWPYLPHHIGMTVHGSPMVLETTREFLSSCPIPPA
jgi:hypothetical protein